MGINNHIDSVLRFSVGSILRPGRFRRDPREMDEDEEMWFNDDEYDDPNTINAANETHQQIQQVRWGSLLLFDLSEVAAAAKTGTVFVGLCFKIPFLTWALKLCQKFSLPVREREAF